MGTNFPCVFVVMLGMTTQAQVSGTELKVRIEKALTEKSLKKLITNLEKELNGEHSFLPHDVETRIRREIASAGVAVSQHGGWYRCIAVYLLLPKLDELLQVKSMGGEQNIASIVQKLRNEALRESLSTSGWKCLHGTLGHPVVQVRHGCVSHASKSSSLWKTFWTLCPLLRDSKMCWTPSLRTPT